MVVASESTDWIDANISHPYNFVQKIKDSAPLPLLTFLVSSFCSVLAFYEERSDIQ
jgi:hypothetical protein